MRGATQHAIVSDRDSAFLTSHSRVLKASDSISSCLLHSTASLVLQSPTGAICFPSQPLPRHLTRKQKCTRLSHVCRTASVISRFDSPFPFPSLFGLAELDMQAFALVTVTVFGRSSPHTKRCVYLCTATITSIECKKRLCMPVRGKCHGQGGALRVVFIQPHSSISYLSVCLIYRFPLLLPLINTAEC